MALCPSTVHCLSVSSVGRLGAHEDPDWRKTSGLQRNPDLKILGLGHAGAARLEDGNPTQYTQEPSQEDRILQKGSGFEFEAPGKGGSRHPAA